MDKIKNKKLLISAAMLLAYAMLTLIGALNHEIWFDEGQAWCIARDNDLLGVIDRLKYEGHPPLWYFILYPFAHLGFSVDVIPLISWFVSVITAALILWKSPFHMAVNASVIFSCGFLFYNSVTSRVYCLIQLFLCLIAIVYPVRKKHPLIFGLLVALLVNTHIIMCGLVGMLGIYMLIDLFKDRKKNSAKDNVLNLCGLAVAGIGVILMILPLLQSMSVSWAGSEVDLSLSVVAERVSGSLYNTGMSLIPENIANVLSYALCCMFSVFILIMFFFLRHYRRAMWLSAVFVLFFVLVTQVIFHVMLPTRAAIFIYVFFFVLWIAKTSDTPVLSDLSKLEHSVDNSIIKKILSAVIRMDKSFDKTLSVMVTAIMLFAMPRGIIALISDYTDDYCLSKSLATFISTELPDDAILVIESGSCAQMSAYYPDARFYSLRYNEFFTYNTHTETPERVDWERVYNDLKDHENVYSLSYANLPKRTDRDNILYEEELKVEKGISLGWAQLTPLDVEKEIPPLIGTDNYTLYGN